MTVSTSHRQLTSYHSTRISLEESPEQRSVFRATSPMEKGDLVLSFGGSVVHTEELQYMSDEARFFAIQLEGDRFLAPDNHEWVEDHRAIVHSCEPNLGFSGPNSLVALRDIAPGEALTLDYSMGYTKMDSFSCDCRSDQCRGTITADDHMHPLLRGRYKGAFTASLEKEHRHFTEADRYYQDFGATGAWGLVTALDLHDCNPETIRSADAIYEFTVEMCKRIGVQRFGEPVIVHFGEDERVAGYSLVQLIETSLVSGHFANQTNRVYLDIFSCAYYDPQEATRFAAEFFGAGSYNQNVYMRY